VDLQADKTFNSLGVALVSVSTDSLADLQAAARQFGITTPLLSDKDSEVSRAYGVLQWAMPSGEPGHTFVLVGKDGTMSWIKDYGAPQNGGLMYVPVADLTRALKEHLP
jgi:peroxiredoxin Q/BCP